MPACPMCAEEVQPGLATCPYCNEALQGPRPEIAEPEPPRSRTVIIVVVIVIVACLLLCMIPMVAAIAIPNLIQARKAGNEAAAIGALRTINTAQALFREGDKDQDGTLQYAGSLQELSDATLIDAVLGSGVKQGYVFQVYASPQTPEFLWMATAGPAAPGTTGDRFFVVNHAGVIYESTGAAFPITPDCSLPPGATPVGKR